MEKSEDEEHLRWVELEEVEETRKSEIFIRKNVVMDKLGERIFEIQSEFGCVVKQNSCFV